MRSDEWLFFMTHETRKFCNVFLQFHYDFLFLAASTQEKSLEWLSKHFLVRKLLENLLINADDAENILSCTNWRRVFSRCNNDSSMPRTTTNFSSNHYDYPSIRPFITCLRAFFTILHATRFTGGESNFPESPQKFSNFSQLAFINFSGDFHASSEKHFHPYYESN